MKATSTYLNKPLRTLDQARMDALATYLRDFDAQCRVREEARDRRALECAGYNPDTMEYIGQE